MKKILLILGLTIFCISSLLADGEQPIGSGTEEEPYQVETLGNLLWISTNNNSWDKYFIQTANINANDTQSWNAGEGFIPIGIDDETSTYFTGFYNGQNHVIDSLFINRALSNYQAFIGIADGALIENLGITNIDVNGDSYVGGFVGSTINSSEINNCYSTGNVNGDYSVGSFVGVNNIGSSINNCYSTAFVSGNNYVSGLVGLNINSASLNNCYSSGNVNGGTRVGGLVGENQAASISNSYSSSDINGSSYVGGLVGYNYSSSTIVNCYSIGNVTGNYLVGGLAGLNNYNSSILNSFWDIETSGWSSSAGGTGKTTAEMLDVATFVDITTVGLSNPWDFVGNPYDDAGNDDYWDIDITINNGYPILRWQINLIANFTSVETAYIGEPVQFTDTSTGNPTTWEWDFENDGIYDSFIQYPTHTYNAEGTYSVKLKISKGTLVDSLTKAITVEYCPPAPPDSVQLTLNYPDVTISWVEVDTTDCGSPIIPDGYIILNKENPNTNFNFLTYTLATVYTHTYVSQYQDKLFYKVIAIKNYSREQIEYLESLNNSREKIKWSDVKRNLEIFK